MFLLLCLPCITCRVYQEISRLYKLRKLELIGHTYFRLKGFSVKVWAKYVWNYPYLYLFVMIFKFTLPYLSFSNISQDWAMQRLFEISRKTVVIQILQNSEALGVRVFLSSFITRIIQEGFLEWISTKKIHFRKNLNHSTLKCLVLWNVSAAYNRHFFQPGMKLWYCSRANSLFIF